MLEQTPGKQRQQLIDASHQTLSLRRQCQLLGVNRSTIYYKAREVDAVAPLGSNGTANRLKKRQVFLVAAILHV